MKISLCGSITYGKEMLATADYLKTKGFQVETPDMNEDRDWSKLTPPEADALKDQLMRQHLDKIYTSDAVLIFNKDKNGIKNYIGGNTLMEMAFAYADNLEIFLLNPIPDMSYALEIAGCRPIILDGQIDRLIDYFNRLPTVLVSSESDIKLRAVSRGLRKAGLRTTVRGIKSNSNVSEQPQTIEETYAGAMHRHDQLLQQGVADYYATIESGNHAFHPNHNVFGSHVVVLQKHGDTLRAGLSADIELPKAMTDKVPAVYSDLGTLVQQEYGMPEKDPYLPITNRKVSRLQLLETAVYNLAVQNDFLN
ncbi:MAG TPA: DUF84 family protein [Verrucomicrobiae bacterium]|nr:DUF84 family protein [Verrucomicrobiae bacterium]